MSGMEAGRTRWTDERLDDLALGVRDDIRELRLEMREFRSEMRDELRDEFRGVRSEMRDGFRGVRGEIAEVRGEAGMNRRLLISLWATTLLGFAGLIVVTGLR